MTNETKTYADGTVATGPGPLPTASPTQPTTEQLLLAFAQGLLPLAGQGGIAAAALIPAVEQFVDNLKASGNTVFTMADLETVAAKTTGDLNQLAADIAAQDTTS